ncbi:MAG TPA: hypothetical protein VIJ41_06510 [Candidatus Nanopelagicales bacterium]
MSAVPAGVCIVCGGLSSTRPRIVDQDEIGSRTLWTVSPSRGPPTKT